MLDQDTRSRLAPAKAPREIDLAALNRGICGAYALHWDEARARKRGLIEAIEERRRRGGGIARTNIGGGWHSETDLPGWKHPAVKALMDFIITSADTVVAATNEVGAGWRRKPWIIQAWANVNPPGGAANALHEHIMMNWHWSGCYYVQCDDIGAGVEAAENAELGRLVFENRWHGLRLNEVSPPPANRLSHSPTEGEVVFFPAWQHHRVEPHHQASDRISIAFNLHSPELERSRYWTYRPGQLSRSFPRAHDLLNRLRGFRAHTSNGTPPGFRIG